MSDPSKLASGLSVHNAFVVVPFLTVLQVPSAAQIIAAMLAAEESRSAQTVRVAATTSERGKVATALYDLSFIRPKKALIAIASSSKHQTCFLDGTTYTLYDPARNEYMRRELHGAPDFGARLGYILGPLDQPVLLALNPTSQEAFFKGIGSLTPWNASVTGRAYRLAHTATARSVRAHIILSVDRTTHLPIEMEFAEGQRDAVYRFTYWPSPRDLSFEPKDAKRVRELYVANDTPAAANEATAKVMQRASDAYDGLKSLAYRVKSDAGADVIVWARNKARQESSDVVWAYDSHTLFVRNLRTGRFGKIVCHSDDIPERLKAFGGHVDATLRVLLQGRNPARTLYSRSMKARLVGQMARGGITLDFLELSMPGLRIQAQIRPNDGLPAEYLTENLDEVGHVLLRDVRTFEYLAKNANYPLATFRLKI